MKIMVVGSGGREHALVWAVKRSHGVTHMVCAPGNDGMASLARCVPVPADDMEGLVKLARAEQPDLVIVGPEVPLTLGLADRLAQIPVSVFGPSAAAARLEGSKSFAKAFMDRHHIPTAKHLVGHNFQEAVAALDRFTLPVVVKADGLAAGKGVTIAETRPDAITAIRQAMEERVFGQAGEQVVLEEYLSGEEASILAFADGRIAVPMVASQDHKRVDDGDQGPNTGGMGAYAPAPVITPDMLARIEREILIPVMEGMAAEGTPYQGVLYAGLMITAEGPKVIEFNCRFGDPETQVVLPLLQSDLVATAQACIRGELNPAAIQWSNQAAVCVVMAAPGYPGPITQGLEISGLEDADTLPDVMVWHAGTIRKQGQWLTRGGRVLNVVAVGDDIAAAVQRVYAACARITFPGAHYRRDIAYRALQRA